MSSGVGHLAEVVSGDVALLAVGLREPPVFVSPLVRELQDSDMLVLLQTELLLTACRKCIYRIELRTHTGYRYSLQKVIISSPSHHKLQLMTLPTSTGINYKSKRLFN